MTLNELSEYVPFPPEETLGVVNKIPILKARFGGLRIDLAKHNHYSSFEYSAKCHSLDGAGKMVLEEVIEGETFVRIGVSKEYHQELFVKQMIHGLILEKKVQVMILILLNYPLINLMMLLLLNIKLLKH
ncbi:MAG: hypothetical protein PVJ67_02530 [Candidatus Pacearchaeota archaeon]